MSTLIFIFLNIQDDRRLQNKKIIIINKTLQLYLNNVIINYLKFKS